MDRRIKDMTQDKSTISPVIATLIMIAITIILGVIMWFMIMGLP